MSPHGPRTVLLTRAADDCVALAAAVRAAQAIPICQPAVIITPLPMTDAMLTVAQQGNAFTALALASRYGVRAYAALLAHAKQRLPPNQPIFAVGPATAAMADRLWQCTSVVAEPHTAVGLAQALLRRLPPKSHVLAPTAKGAGHVLVATLAQGDIACTLLPVYATDLALPGQTGQAVTVPPTVDYIVFTSPSCVRGYVRQGGRPGKARILTIGPTTTQAVLAEGFTVAGQAEPSNLLGLIALVREQLCLPLPPL